MEFFNYIDDYKNGTLKGETLHLFEKEVKTNVSLKKAIDNYDAAKAISEGLLEIDIMTTIKKLKSENQDAEDVPLEIQLPTKIFQLRKWLVAASFIGIIALAGWWLLSQNEKASIKKEIWAQYVKPIDVDASKSIDTVGMDLFEKGKYYFALNHFKNAEQFLLQITPSEISKRKLSKVKYWLGHAYMNQSKWSKAIEALKQSEEEGVEQDLGLCEQMK